MATRRHPPESSSTFSRSRNESSKGDRSAHQHVNQVERFQGNSRGRKRARSESQQHESYRRVGPYSPVHRGTPRNPDHITNGIWQHVNLPEEKRVVTLVSKRGGKSSPGIMRDNNRVGVSKPRGSDGGSGERYYDQTYPSRIEGRKGSVDRTKNTIDTSPNRLVRERYRSLGDGYSSDRYMRLV